MTYQQPTYPVGPPPGHPAWGQPQMPQPRTSGLAITALILGVIACTSPIAVPLAIVALIRIRSRGERGFGLAVAGLTAALAWITLSVLLVATGSVHLWVGNVETSTSAAKPVFDSLHTGDCLDNVTGLTSDADAQHVRLKVISCEQPHDAQVMTFAHLSDHDWSDRSGITSDARTSCETALTGMSGKVPSGTRVQAAYLFADTESSWDANHSAACLFVRSGDRKLTGAFD
ncbi:DUF4190 domain-containing protein [Nocardia vaccinii]|uniref:DUF4190 domain-containing protein n=1 Tax=Nocardia vaccinii TaxID=1822 RepID=UPI00082D1FCD|nr:DUF4190 domain-containing protein [Nocardia vaccinii]